ncbi:hypothetical protein V8G54_030479 [Vigna mungo]|uniref:Uncharacterized protein n=1 Tax=Vigna mungo TaxID=3915 RepID=A0AAQ3RK47_VIGMU
MAGDGTATCIDILLAIILPPLGVFLKYGCKVFINFTCFFFLLHKDFSRNFGYYFLFRVREFRVWLIQYMVDGLSLQVEFWICLVLTLFGYIPGIIYAVYAITK